MPVAEILRHLRANGDEASYTILRHRVNEIRSILQGAVFNHTFNINSGPHKQFNYKQCHQVPANYSIVSCTHCHEHRQSKADDTQKTCLGIRGIVRHV